MSNNLTFHYKGGAARYYQHLVLETGDPAMMGRAISSGPRLKADDLIGYMINGAPQVRDAAIRVALDKGPKKAANFARRHMAAHLPPGY